MSRRLEAVLELPDSEEFVRRALSALEGELREMALRALAAWDAARIVSPDLFVAVGGLQRPSWGSWNGLLAALRTARRNALRSGRPGEREQAEKATGLSELLARLDEAAGLDVSALTQLLRSSVKRPRFSDVLALPISLRNRVAHDMPGDKDWWKQADEALRPLVAWQAGRRDLRAEGDACPWIVVEGAETWSFNGLGEDFAATYVTRSGAVRQDRDRGREVLSALKRLLRKEDVQETDFRRLLTKLAPEELKGVMMGDFLVGRPVGRGGFAQVHAGRQLSTGRKVAIKILHDGLDETSKSRFQQEAAYLARFDHSNIVKVLGYGEESWSAPRSFSLSGEDWFVEFSKGASVRTFIALEWIEGKTLDEVFRGERAGAKPVTGWFVQAADALSVVHAAGLIHRDVKPGNLMVTESGAIKLMDFGIARSQGEARTLVTTAGASLGTPAYMSPEQLLARNAEAELGPSTDVYSLCATFYELYTGRRLFDHDRENEDTVRTRKSRGELPTRPRMFVSELPWEIETLLLGGLQKELGDRLRSMEALGSDLRRYLNDEPIQYRTPSLARRAQLAYRRNRAMSNLAGVFLLAAVAGTSAYVASLKNEQARTEEQRLTAVTQKALAESNATEAARQRDIASANADLERKERDRADAEAAEAKRQLARVHLQKAAFAREQGRFQAEVVHLGAARELDPASVSEGNWCAALGRGRGPVWTSSVNFPGLQSQFALSQDCRIAVGPSAGTDCLVWDVQTGQVLRTLKGHTGRGSTGVAMSADGRTALSGGWDGTLRLWDVGTGGLLKTLRGHDDMIFCVALSPDGQQALSGGLDKTMRLWDLQSGNLLRTFAGHENWVTSVAFDAHARRVASGSEDTTVRVWDLETAASLQTLRGHTSRITAVAFGLGPQFLVSTGEDGTLRVWDTETGGTVRQLEACMTMAVSPDGRRVLAPGTRDGTLRLWDLQTGQSIRTFEGAGGRGVALSADGSFAFAARAGAICIWDVETGKSLRSIQGNKESISSVAFNPEGSSVLCGSWDSTLCLRDAKTGEVLLSYVGHRGTVSSVAISPDGRFAVSGSMDHSLRGWMLETGKPLGVLSGHTGPVTSVAIGNDGKRCLSGSWDKTLRLWDLENGGTLRVFEGHTAHVSSVALSPDGQFALSGCADSRVILWDAETARPVREFVGHTGSVDHVTFSPDGRFALSGGDDRNLRLWDVETGAMLRLFIGHAAAVQCVAISPDGRFALSGSEDRTVRLWDMGTGRIVRTWEGHTYWVYGVAFSRDGKFVCSAGADATVRVWRVEAGSSVRTYEGHSAEVFDSDISPDGHLLLSGGADRTVRLWEAETGRTLQILEGHSLAVTDVAFSPDGRRALSGSLDTTARLWDLKGDGTHRTLEGHAGAVYGVAFSPNGELALTGSIDKTMRLWEVETGKLLRTFEGHSKEVTRVAFSPDGRFALSGSCDTTLRLWDIQTGRTIRVFEGHVVPVYSVAFSPDGHFAVSACSNEDSVRLWDVDTGKTVRKFEGEAGEGMRRAIISPDGRFVLSASKNRNLRLWNAATGESLRVLQGHTGSVEGVSFSADGRFAVSGSEDRTLRLWDTSEITVAAGGAISDSSSIASRVTGLALKDLDPAPVLPPLELPTWTTADGLPPAFLRTPIPDWLGPLERVPSGDLRRWTVEWEACERRRSGR